jgi:hypothetical protein
VAVIATAVIMGMGVRHSLKAYTKKYADIHFVENFLLVSKSFSNSASFDAGQFGRKNIFV